MTKEIEVESTLPQDWLFSLLQESWAQTKCSEDRNRNAPGVKSNKFRSDKLCLKYFSTCILLEIPVHFKSTQVKSQIEGWQMISFNNWDLSNEKTYTPFVLVDITSLLAKQCKTPLKR